MDWAELFRFDTSPLELFMRGTLMYWFLFLGFRIILRRDTGAIGIADVLLIVLIADAAQNGMAGEYRSVAEGMVLVGTLMAWNVLFDFVAFHVEFLRRWMEPPPLKLIDQGRVLHRNLRREFMSPDELMAKLREHGVDDVQRVRACFMESDGHVTVLLYDGMQAGAAAARHVSSTRH